MKDAFSAFLVPALCSVAYTSVSVRGFLEAINAPQLLAYHRFCFLKPDSRLLSASLGARLPLVRQSCAGKADLGGQI